MDTVVISRGFEIRLPKRSREALGLAPGQRLRVVPYAGRIELVPFRPALECPGLFGAADTGDGAPDGAGDGAADGAGYSPRGGSR
jgi:AbrB family looped-hinge helix DNA binding protein